MPGTLHLICLPVFVIPSAPTRSQKVPGVTSRTNESGELDCEIDTGTLEIDIDGIGATEFELQAVVSIKKGKQAT